MLTVPVGKKETYQNAAGWSQFARIVEESGPVTLTAKSYTREYGEGNPTFEYSLEGNLADDGQPAFFCYADITSPIGTYPIIIMRGDVANYDGIYIGGTLTIEKAPLKVTAKSYTIKQGDALPTFEAEYAGFKNDETSDVLTKQPTITTTATSASAPGVYDITVSGAEAQNYEISYVNGKLTITQSDGIKIVSLEQPVDVYNIQGQKVRSNVTSFEGLPKGVYIINGRKVVIK